MADASGAPEHWRDSTLLRTAGSVLFVIVLLLGVWFVVDLLRVRAALLDAGTHADALADTLSSPENGSPTAEANRISELAHHAHDIADGPVWSLAAHVPFVGKNARALTRATAALDDIAANGVPALTAFARERDGGALSIEDGRVDVQGLSELSGVFDRADRSLTRGRKVFDDLRNDGLLGLVDTALGAVGEGIDQAQSLVHTGSTAIRLAPDMLGANSTRHYLLIFQNNAEIRSTGGLPGAFALLRVEDGRITMESQGAQSEVGPFIPPAVHVHRDERTLWGTLPAKFWADTNLTPDFPRTAEILRAMYKIRYGRSVDGVISIDPVTLTRVLLATGPVRLANGTQLSAQNALPLLLNQVYRKFADNDAAQNAFFADAARRVFNKFLTGGAQPASLFGQLRASVDEGRILINATRPNEQDVLADTKVAGALPVEKTSRPHFGLYLNDGTAAKLQYYLKRTTDVEPLSCSSDGTQQFQIRTELRSTAPANVTTLGPSVVGTGFGARNGTQRLVLAYYAPAGGRVTAMSVDGENRTVSTTTHDGLTVSTVLVDLPPGGRHVVTTTVESARGQDGDGSFRTTPGFDPIPNIRRIPTPCS